MEQAAALRAMNTYRYNDTSAQPQSERITIQGSRKSIAFVGKESNRLISDAFAERQNEPKGELRTPSQAMGAARSDDGEVKFLWSVLAKHRLKLLQNKENKLYPSFGTGTA